MPRRRICFVTGTRAEFGLMSTALRAIESHPRLRLQIVVTGMHLDRLRGDSVARVRAEGWPVGAVVPWPRSDSPVARAAACGRAAAGLARAFERLRSDVVLVVGDRVEALAAAMAGHLSDRIVAHVHGGDRAMGQADDSLRHAITKLSQVHFAATRASAQRIARLGEDRWRIHQVGAPGIDDIRRLAVSRSAVASLLGDSSAFALLVQHPVEPDERREFDRARAILAALLRCGAGRVVIVYPNNDPGSGGILRCWEQAAAGDARVVCFRNLDRPAFLGLLRDAVVLAGNSSAGIIEAASFGTPVVDIGPRQSGREHGANVVHAEPRPRDLQAVLSRFRRNGQWMRFPQTNPYGGRGAGRKIAQALASLKIDARMLRKLIAY